MSDSTKTIFFLQLFKMSLLSLEVIYSYKSADQSINVINMPGTCNVAECVNGMIITLQWSKEILCDCDPNQVSSHRTF